MASNKKKLTILCIVLWVVFILGFGYLSYKKVSNKNPEEFIERIDSLDSRIDSIYIIKDSIQERVDTVYIKLQDNNKQYEEDVNRIINNDADEDCSFFLEYINSNRARLDSISNNL